MAYSVHNYASGGNIKASDLNAMDAQIANNDARITQFVGTNVLSESDAEVVATNVINASSIGMTSSYNALCGINGVGGYINYDTVNSTISIPYDTVLLGKSISGSNDYALPTSDNQPTVITGVSRASKGSSALKLIYNIDTSEFSVVKYTAKQTRNQLLIAGIRCPYSTYKPLIVSAFPWSINGNPYGIEVDNTESFEHFVKTVNHRGYSATAPENTLTAFKLSKKNGYKYVETDVAFTSDNIPVLLHDATIDRTSNGTGNVGSFTLEQLKTYDFGSWKSAEYTGEKIPSFEEFIALCRNLSLHPYIELKSSATYTSEQIASCVNIVRKYGMLRNCTWISFYPTYLEYVKSADSKARLGLLVASANIVDSNVDTCLSLRNGNNEVFMDVSGITDAVLNRCIENDIPVEFWTLDTDAAILALNPYVSGVTSNSKNAGKILANANM